MTWNSTSRKEGTSEHHIDGTLQERSLLAIPNLLTRSILINLFLSLSLFIAIFTSRMYVIIYWYFCSDENSLIILQYNILAILFIKYLQYCTLHSHSWIFSIKSHISIATCSQISQPTKCYRQVKIKCHRRLLESRNKEKLNKEIKYQPSSLQ